MRPQQVSLRVTKNRPTELLRYSATASIAAKIAFTPALLLVHFAAATSLCTVAYFADKATSDVLQ